MDRSSEKGTPRLEQALPRWVLAGLLVIAIAYQVFENIRADTFYLTPDKMHHVSSAQAMLQGFGMSHVFANPANLAEPVVEPHTLWSNGYSVLVALGLALTRNLYLTLTLIDCLSTVLFFVAWWGITGKLDALLGATGRILILGWWTFVHSPLATSTMDASGSSDMLSVALFSAGIWVSIGMFSGRRVFLNALLSGVCFGAAAGVRYAYWPLIVAGPLAWVALERKRNFRTSLPALAQFAAATVFIVWISASQPGDATYTVHDRIEKGIYLSQLSSMFPFPANAIGVFPALRSASGHLPIDFLAFSGTVWILWIFSAGLVLAAVVEPVAFLRRYFRRREAGTAESVAAQVIITTAAAMAITVAMLLYLTIRVPDDYGWTYGAMPRYYIPAEMFLFLGLAAAFNRAWNRARRNRSLPLTMALFGVVAIVAAGPLAHRAGRIYAMASGAHRPSEFTTTVKLLQKEIGALRESGVPVVYADTDPERVLVAGMAGARMLLVNEPKNLPSLENSGAIVVARFSKPEGNATAELLASRLREQGAEVVFAGERFDLLVLYPAMGDRR